MRIGVLGTAAIAPAAVLKPASEVEGVEVYDVEPTRLPNLYHGMPVRLYGRYRGQGPAKVAIRADVGSIELKKSFDISLPATDDAEIHSALVERICRKISGAVDSLTSVEADVQEGAEVGILSYGISARSSAGAVRLLREQGRSVSHLRLKTVFPRLQAVV